MNPSRFLSFFIPALILASILLTYLCASPSLEELTGHARPRAQIMTATWGPE